MKRNFRNGDKSQTIVKNRIVWVFEGSRVSNSLKNLFMKNLKTKQLKLETKCY